MIEGENEIDMEDSRSFDFDDLIIKVLVREPLLLYFVCRRGSWTHQNNRGKKHPPLDSRGIINDREIDCKFLARFQFNNGKKDSRLVSVKPRKKWEKSMHNIPAKYCKLTNLGKKLYQYLKHNGMVQIIENDFSIGNNIEFVNNFVAKFNLQLPENNEFEKINKNQRKRIDYHRQESKNKALFRKVNHKEIYSYKNSEEIINFCSPISYKVSRFRSDKNINIYSFLDDEVLALLSKEYQTILDIVYNYRITENGYMVALKTKLIELSNLKKIEVDLVNGNKAWRLKNC